MRGKALSAAAIRCGPRITPAYAGKSSACAVDEKPSGDHPRVCGEKKRLAACAQTAEGSPPRMRGKVLAALMPTNALGITPAYAGKSFS